MENKNKTRVTAKKRVKTMAADGKTINNDPDKQPKSLADILGLTKKSPYETTDQAEYEKYLKSMNLSDLQTHSIKIGIVPNTDRENLTRRLAKEFKRHNSSYLGAIEGGMPQMDQEKAEIALKILANGR